MAKSTSKRSVAGRIILTLLVLGLVVVAAVLWTNRAAVTGYSDVATSYAARVACSCRFVAGRSLDDCTKDKLAGMELVSLSEDVDARNVTASIPLVSSSTASIKQGYGCVLEEWQD